MEEVQHRKTKEMIKLTRKDKHMQVKCPKCKFWLESDVHQTENGHKFHKNCLKMTKNEGRCQLCVEDKIMPENDCYQLEVEYMDVAAMKDVDNAKVECGSCGFKGSYGALKKEHAERGCKYKCVTCAIC